MKEPTLAQLLVLAVIHNHFQEHGTPPTLREIAHARGCLTKEGAVTIVNALERKGLIERIPRISRGIRVTEAGMQALWDNSIKEERT
jgi:repressor LexA